MGDAPFALCSSRQLAHDLKNFVFHSDDVITVVDAKELYPNIDSTDLLFRITTRIRQHFGSFQYGSFLIEIMHLAIRHQYIASQGRFWAAHGIATGLSAGVVLAQIYLADLDCEVEPHMRFYRRYIDDSILIGPAHNATKTIAFMNQFSRVSWELQHQGRNDIPYLDLSLTIHGSQISYKTFRKPMNAYLFPSAISCHNAGVAENILKSEIHRYAATNSFSGNVDAEVTFLIRKLVDRGFQRRSLEAHAARVLKRIRKPSKAPTAQCLYKARRFLVLTRSHSVCAAGIRKILRRHAHLIQPRIEIGLSFRLQRSYFRRMYHRNFFDPQGRDGGMRILKPPHT